MKCPIDSTDLVMSDRQGIEIDYCPKCRGVWLDRGELDKIIERAAQAEAPRSEPVRAAAAVPPQYQNAPHYQDDRRYNDRRDYDERHGHGKPYRKRKSFLSDIFEFD
jgi:Zn-finger nucleic acid-binding protein